MASPFRSSGHRIGATVYRVRVTLGEHWCLQQEDSVEVVHVDSLAQVGPAARSWIAQRHGMPVEALNLRLDFVMPTEDGWVSRRPAPLWWIKQ